MEKIVKFSSLKDYLNFLGKKNCSNRYLIGEGAEGKCFFSPTDGCVYKLITKKDYNGERIANYDVKKIITTHDLELSQYILPEELYIINNELIGYKTKYIKEKSIFDETNPKETIKKLQELKEKVLIEGYYKILEETDKLSKEQIEIYDLTYNLLFTGEQYYGIDTCGYQQTNEENILTYNRDYLNEAIKENFYTILKRAHIYPKESIYELDNREDMEDYCKGIIKLIKTRK